MAHANTLAWRNNPTSIGTKALPRCTILFTKPPSSKCAHRERCAWHTIAYSPKHAGMKRRVSENVVEISSTGTPRFRRGLILSLIHIFIPDFPIVGSPQWVHAKQRIWKPRSSLPRSSLVGAVGLRPRSRESDPVSYTHLMRYRARPSRGPQPNAGSEPCPQYGPASFPRLPGARS